MRTRTINSACTNKGARLVLLCLLLWQATNKEVAAQNDFWEQTNGPLGGDIGQLLSTVMDIFL